eukprot:Tamp_13217.p1 GENE.Tamp_13217~~Tamp_13217.p1  ORF type:complete len:537 (+),score=104.25 Tamp_13217:98-1612(+)
MRIEGVTIVHGNGSDVRQLGINANVCLRLAGAAPGVQVYLGDGKPVAQVEITEASHAGVDVHGADALGEVRPATVDSDLQFGALSAKDFLYQRCAALPGQVTLVTLGPLTNVAACLREHPDLPRLVKRIVIMGGAVLEKRGNRTPSSEANFADDPTAAHEVLTAGFADLVLAPLDVTHQIDLVALRTSLGESKGELAGFMHDISRFYVAAYFKLNHSRVPVHDPVPIAYLLQTNLFKWRDVRVDVETEGRITSGMSVADWTGQSRRPVNARVLLHVDAPAFCSFFLSQIAQRDAEHATRPNKRLRIANPPPLPPPGDCKGPPSCCPQTQTQTPNLTQAHAQPHPRVGVGVLLLQEGRAGHVLVGRRRGSHGSGLCQLPGGHLEMCESWEQCAVRELEEETGIVIKRAWFAGVTNDDMTDVAANKHYITIFMIGCCAAHQEPKLMEPDKCEGWSWEPWDKLPSKSNLFHPLDKLSKSGFALPDPAALVSSSYPAAKFSADCAYVT